jgi:hypothetical protein
MSKDSKKKPDFNQVKIRLSIGGAKCGQVFALESNLVRLLVGNKGHTVLTKQQAQLLMVSVINNLLPAFDRVSQLSDEEIDQALALPDSQKVMPKDMADKPPPDPNEGPSLIIRP